MYVCVCVALTHTHMKANVQTYIQHYFMQLKLTTKTQVRTKQVDFLGIGGTTNITQHCHNLADVCICVGGGHLCLDAPVSLEQITQLRHQTSNCLPLNPEPD